LPLGICACAYCPSLPFPMSEPALAPPTLLHFARGRSACRHPSMVCRPRPALVAFEPLRIYVQPRPPSGPLFAHSTRAQPCPHPSTVWLAPKFLILRYLFYSIVPIPTLLARRPAIQHRGFSQLPASRSTVSFASSHVSQCAHSYARSVTPPAEGFAADGGVAGARRKPTPPIIAPCPRWF
jgi:hypothetical protein